MQKTPDRLTADRSPRAMARRTVRSLIPRIAAASRAEYGQMSAAPDTSLSVVARVVRSSMIAGASRIGAVRARDSSTTVVTHANFTGAADLSHPAGTADGTPALLSGRQQFPVSSRPPRPPLSSPWAEQVDPVVLRFTADDVVAMAAD